MLALSQQRAHPSTLEHRYPSSECVDRANNNNIIWTLSQGTASLPCQLSCRYLHTLVFQVLSFAFQTPAHFIKKSSLYPSAGQYKIQELDKLMLAMHKQYGKIAKVGGLIGHPDLLFIYDGDEIRKVFQREEIQPHRYRITPPHPTHTSIKQSI